jgi:hypothetical protein
LRTAGWMPEWLFWLLQALVLPVWVTIVIQQASDRFKEEYGLTKESKVTPSGGAFVVLTNVLIGVAVAYQLYPEASVVARIALGLVALVFYGFYLVSIIGTPTRATAITAIAPDPITAPEQGPTLDWIDQNDAAVARVESSRVSMSQRVEAYTVEATLFGALAFSGFLTLLVEQPDTLQRSRELLDVAWSLLSRITTLGQSTLVPLPASFSSHYLGGVALSALTCSSFFLSVILARLRFSDAVQRADYALHLLRAYEAKEEAHYLALAQSIDEGATGRLRDRMAGLRHQVTEASFFADRALDELRPVVMYMSIFRTCGILAFLLALVLSAAAISTGLATVLMLLSLIAFLYPGLDRQFRDGKWLKIAFFQRGHRFSLPKRGG